ncbi:MFS transporter [Streptomyces tubbatahanensis]|uniref:MFS transporter n=1 Tax=Streptomyces tubbatahanensis TaxID=2923272 RepID=A0ABY3XM18_9ACTN|nr:MFS transporter [Streptomyces tubbatahanensis]UNS95457.1 MFS transporter [Streptomyces tubbatahanensis]
MPDPRLTPSPPPPARGHGLTRLHVLVLAVASAVTASNVYLSQPLLEEIAGSLRADAALLGAIPTATQLGYAAGILLLVPAGDSHDRRRLILVLTACSGLALAASAAATSAWLLAAAGFATGLLSPVPQLVTPLAVALSEPPEGRPGGRGRVVGTVQAGLLVGILASRAYAGALAELVGWRGVYAVSCALTLVLAVVLRRCLPADPAPAGTEGYLACLASLPRLAARPPVARVVFSGALVGVAFGAFWTTLTFLLARHYHYDSARIGLFGLVAAASALASPWAGRLADRYGPRRGLAALTAAVIAGWLVLLPGGTSLAWLVAGIVLLDVGVWGNQTVSQTALFSLPTHLHNRLNTSYFTCRFAGIATGSLAGSLAWSAAGWPAVAALGATCATLGLALGLLPHRAHTEPAA